MRGGRSGTAALAAIAVAIAIAGRVLAQDATVARPEDAVPGARAESGADAEPGADTAPAAQTEPGADGAAAGAEPEGVAVSDPPGDGVEIAVPIDDQAFAITLGGYVETGFTWSFGDPSNGIVAWRGFDNRHATFTLANVALRTRFEYDRVYTAITIQWGNTPDTYYLAEPTSGPSVPSGVGESSLATWRFLQEAYLGWDVPLAGGIALEGGLFLSPIGFEGMAVRGNWHWSRSNLFYGCPFYHTGVRVTVPAGDELSVSVAAFNGWNSVLDNNDEKSVAAWLDYATDIVALRVLYFGGVERVGGRWRSLFDAWVRVSPTSWIDFALHGDAGFEPIARPGGEAFGWWAAGAAYVRVRPIEWLSLAVRADVFVDRSPGDDRTLRIFWPTTPLVSSQTITAMLTPEEHVSFFVEYRHDHTASSRDLGGSGPSESSFFAGDVATDAGGLPIANATTQDTITFGATAGF